MSVQHNHPQDGAVRQHEAAADKWVRVRFGVEPSGDRSGLLASEPTPTPGEPDKEGQLAAYMRRHFWSVASPTKRRLLQMRGAARREFTSSSLPAR